MTRLGLSKQLSLLSAQPEGTKVILLARKSHFLGSY